MDYSVLTVAVFILFSHFVTISLCHQVNFLLNNSQQLLLNDIIANHLNNCVNRTVICDNVSYTRQQLKCFNNISLSVNNKTLCLLTKFGIRNLANSELKKRKRGKRGGVRKRRQIKVINNVNNKEINMNRCGNINNKEKEIRRGVNRSNLIEINTCKIVRETLDTNCKILYINAQSVCNKTMTISDIIIETLPELFFITETWLPSENFKHITSQLTPTGYKIHTNSRKSRGGGGVCVIYRDCIKPIIEDITNFSSFECTKITAFNTIFLCVYHPPPSQKNASSNKIFVEEFADFLEPYSNTRDNIIILGDFNLHFDNPTATYVQYTTSLLNAHQLKQLITKPTQKKGHILDWLITREDTNIVYDIQITDKVVSDHYLLCFSLNIPKPRHVRQQISSRNLKSIDMELFRKTLFTEFSNQTDSVNHDLVEYYNCRLLKAIDEHAPVKTRLVNQRPAAPWYTIDIKLAKQERRRAERKWKKSQLTIDKQIYIHNVQIVKDLIINNRKTYYCDKIKHCKNSKALFDIANEMKGISKTSLLPFKIPDCELPDKFGQFFLDKITKIRSDLDKSAIISQSRTNAENCYIPYQGSTIKDFKPVTEDEVRKIIKSSPAKSCSLDPIPTTLLYQCLDPVLHYITKIINHSLQFGQFPSHFKKAVVTPLLKKHNLDPENLNNYRPVSNLPFVSKILEKVVLAQLKQHLEINNLIEPFQSAYRDNHSTETALLKITNDILRSSDDGNVTILTFLDFSSAFDTIDHTFLIERLSSKFGISGNVLSWLTSYLTGRSQSVTIKDKTSKQFALDFGVPQGSVLGPILYTLYTSSLSLSFNSYNINYHMYADDTQFYKASDISDLPLLISEIENCVKDVKSWTDSNKLKLNNNKTEIIMCSTESKLNQLTVKGMQFDNNFIEFTHVTKSLGVYIDSTLNMETQINNTVKLIYFELRRIYKMKPYLTSDAIKTLVSSLVLSRLDYCNSLLAGLQDEKISKLQRAQNCAARLIFSKTKFDSSTALLKSLHWLPVKARIDYKIAVICFKFFGSSLPSYLNDLLSVYTPSRSLRSQGSKLLKVPRIKLKKCGERSFSHYAPVLWNSLPQNLRSAGSIEVFKKDLKTYLFTEYF